MKKPTKLTLISILLCGGLAGWFLRPVLEDPPFVPFADFGGNFDCILIAEVTWHPETKWEGRNFIRYKNTWKWVFRNPSEEPIRFSIPRQKMRLYSSQNTCQFIDLPETMLVETPITIAPKEERVFTARMSGGSWHEARDYEKAFQVVVKINDLYHPFTCGATVREARMEEPAKPGATTTSPKLHAINWKPAVKSLEDYRKENTTRRIFAFFTMDGFDSIGIILADELARKREEIFGDEMVLFVKFDCIGEDNLGRQELEKLNLHYIPVFVTNGPDGWRHTSNSNDYDELKTGFIKEVTDLIR